MRGILAFAAVIIGLMTGWGPTPALAGEAPEIREKLIYQVSLGPWDNVARVQLVLKRLPSGHYLAEFSGAAQGVWRLLSRWLPERYQTEMVYRDGRLLPLLFLEEFQCQGRRFRKEYHFDYEQRRLTLWSKARSGEMVKKWEAPLNEPVYDLLSLFYNFRLGSMGTPPDGANLKITLLPAPEPQELVCRFGSDNGEGRKVMVNWRVPGSATENSGFITLSPERAPILAWMRVTFFGKLGGRLLNPGEIRKEGLITPAAAIQGGVK
jgi:hypothetical protein